MAYTAWSVVYGEQPTAAKWNQLGANDAGFKDGTNIDSLAITTAKLAAAAVTPDKLGTGGNTASIQTSQATSSTSYTDLATVGPSVTVTIGANGLALVLFSTIQTNSSASGYSDCSIDISGATTISANTNGATNNRRTYWLGTVDNKQAFGYLFTGLTPGSTTFKMQYRAIVTGTATFSGRHLSVIPL